MGGRRAPPSLKEAHQPGFDGCPRTTVARGTAVTAAAYSPAATCCTQGCAASNAAAALSTATSPRRLPRSGARREAGAREAAGDRDRGQAEHGEGVGEVRALHGLAHRLAVDLQHVGVLDGESRHRRRGVIQRSRAARNSRTVPLARPQQLGRGRCRVTTAPAPPPCSPRDLPATPRGARALVRMAGDHHRRARETDDLRNILHVGARRLHARAGGRKRPPRARRCCAPRRRRAADRRDPPSTRSASPSRWALRGAEQLARVIRRIRERSSDPPSRTHSAVSATVRARVFQRVRSHARRMGSAGSVPTCAESRRRRRRPPVRAGAAEVTPCASGHMPAARAAAEPPLDPPAVRVRFHGLRVATKRRSRCLGRPRTRAYSLADHDGACRRSRCTTSAPRRHVVLEELGAVRRTNAAGGVTSLMRRARRRWRSVAPSASRRCAARAPTGRNPGPP